MRHHVLRRWWGRVLHPSLGPAVGAGRGRGASAPFSRPLQLNLPPAEEASVVRTWRRLILGFRGFIDGSFAPAKKGAPKSARPNAAREPSGWYWSMARVLRWEHTWTRRPRRTTSSSARPSLPSKSPGRIGRGG